jgi:predicted permease
MRALRLAIRMLLKAPLVTTVAVLSLALGIGANTAMFSLFHELLMRPLPVRSPEGLVNLSAPAPKPGSQSCNEAGDCDAVFSYAMFRDLAEKPVPAFAGIAAHRLFPVNLSYEGQTVNGDGLMVSGRYFQVLGLEPALGRLITPDDDRTIGETAVVVLSHDYWRDRFASSPAVLTASIIVNGQLLKIVGVAPDGFRGTTIGARPQVFVPMTLRGALEPTFKGFDDRRNYWIYLFGRLAPGMSRAAADAAINTRYHAIVNDVEATLQTGMSDATLARFRAKRLEVAPGARGQSSVPGQARPAIAVLFVVTAIVLVIACANIANLLLARSSARAGEIAVRLSIGASRARLVGQLLIEACLLSVLGGVAGLLVAKGTLVLIASLLPSEATSTMTFSLDAPVLLFAFALSLATGIAFGLFPALHSTRPDLASTLKGIAGQPAGARSAAWFRTGLVTAQIMLSIALLGCAGLFIKSLMRVSRVDLGFTPDRIVTFGLSPRLNGYAAERSQALFDHVQEELATVPGVTGVTAGAVPLVSGNNWGNDVRVQGFQFGPDTDVNARVNEVATGYFRTLAIPLLAGRDFTRADAGDAPHVAIVNESFAKKFGLGRDAVGKRMARNNDSGKPLDIEIIGLARDAKYSNVKDTTPPVLFTPFRQDSHLGSMHFYVRTGVETAAIFGTIRHVVARIDPNLPVEDLRTLSDQVRENVFVDRLNSTLAASFAVLATLLAAVGLYGVLAYTVSQRTREIGLRMALGASPRHVGTMVLRQVGWMTLIGGVAGLATIFLTGRYAESLLFEMKANDPTVLISAAAVLALVAGAAGLVPARRASRLDPMRALRYE